MWLCTLNHCRDLVVYNLWCESVECLVGCFWDVILCVCVCECACACQALCSSPLMSYNNWLSKGFIVSGWYCTLRNVERCLLLPQSGIRPHRKWPWWRNTDQSNRECRRASSAPTTLKSPVSQPIRFSKNFLGPKASNKTPNSLPNLMSLSRCLCNTLLPFVMSQSPLLSNTEECFASVGLPQLVAMDVRSTFRVTWAPSNEIPLGFLHSNAVTPRS